MRAMLLLRQTNACRLLVASTLVCGLLGCEPERKPDATPVIETVADSPQQDQAIPGEFGLGVVNGRVRLDATRPPGKRLPMEGDPACARPGQVVMHPGRIVAEDGGLANAFVYIRNGISGAYPIPEEPIHLDQKGCLFSPRVFGIRVGQLLRITNSDATYHNVHSLPKRNRTINIAQPREGQEDTTVFKRPEVMVKLKCDVHGWMEAYAGVVSHPFYAVSDATGAFEISRLPAGSYRIEVWHELWGRVDRQVTLKQGESIDLEIVYSASGRS